MIGSFISIWFNQIVGLIVGVLMVPLLVAAIGLAESGFWLTVLSVSNIALVLDWGFSNQCNRVSGRGGSEAASDMPIRWARVAGLYYVGEFLRFCLVYFWFVLMLQIGVCLFLFQDIYFYKNIVIVICLSVSALVVAVCRILLIAYEGAGFVARARLFMTFQVTVLNVGAYLIAVYTSGSVFCMAIGYLFCSVSVLGVILICDYFWLLRDRGNLPPLFLKMRNFGMHDGGAVGLIGISAIGFAYLQIPLVTYLVGPQIAPVYSYVQKIFLFISNFIGQVIVPFSVKFMNLMRGSVSDSVKYYSRVSRLFFLMLIPCWVVGSISLYFILRLILPDLRDLQLGVYILMAIDAMLIVMSSFVMRFQMTIDARGLGLANLYSLISFAVTSLIFGSLYGIALIPLMSIISLLVFYHRINWAKHHAILRGELSLVSV